jgi:hypothetical protein
VGILCADHARPLYPQKLALNSPTGEGHSVGIVRLRTKATEFSIRFELIKEISHRVQESLSLDPVM